MNWVEKTLLGIVLIASLAWVDKQGKADTLDFLCCSRHADREAGYNEENYGLFYTTDSNWVFGGYRNSEDNNSFVVGKTYKMYDSKYLDVDVKLGLVTGYSYGGVVPFILPEFVVADRLILHWFPSVERHRYEVGDGTIAEDEDLRMNWALSFRIKEW